MEAVKGATERAANVFLAVAVHVKNASEGLLQKNVLESIQRKKMPLYLLRAIFRYLQIRLRRLNDSGVAKGPPLGPLLWYLTYDDIFKLVDLPQEVDLLAYVDGLAVKTRIVHLNQWNQLNFDVSY